MPVLRTSVVMVSPVDGVGSRLTPPHTVLIAVWSKEV